MCIGVMLYTGTTGMPMEYLVKNVAAICVKKGGAVGHILRTWLIPRRVSQSVALLNNKIREELSEIAFGKGSQSRRCYTKQEEYEG